MNIIQDKRETIIRENNSAQEKLINILETHDRFQHLIKDQSANIFQGAEDCLKKNPFAVNEGICSTDVAS